MLTNKNYIAQHLKTDMGKVFEWEKWIAQAERSLRQYIGDTKYDALVAVTDSSTAEEQAQQERAIRAESLFTFYHGAMFMNLIEGDCEAFVRATGFDTTRIEIMSARELSYYRKVAKVQALELLDDMIVMDQLFGVI